MYLSGGAASGTGFLTGGFRGTRGATGARGAKRRGAKEREGWRGGKRDGVLTGNLGTGTLGAGGRSS